mgnify:FL=1
MQFLFIRLVNGISGSASLSVFVPQLKFETRTELYFTYTLCFKAQIVIKMLVTLNLQFEYLFLFPINPNSLLLPNCTLEHAENNSNL